VQRLVLAGMSRAEIAQALDCKASNVTYHVVRLGLTFAKEDAA
jgi:DNA-binding CsgD family transcriptional regulator